MEQRSSSEEHTRKELEELRGETDALTEILKTKDKMLDDQNELIGQLKSGLAERDEELRGLNEGRNKHKEYYEDKL